MFLLAFHSNSVHRAPFGYIEILVENRRFKPTTPPIGVTPSEFLRNRYQQKTRVPGLIVCCCLRDPMFSRFGTVLACDGLTEKHTMTAYAALA